MKKTAIEWLIDEHFGGLENVTPDFIDKIQHAKEMENIQSKKYAVFAINCDRIQLKILNFNDFIKL